MDWRGRTLKASDLAKAVAPEARRLVQIGDRRQCYFSVTVRIPDIDHKVRSVVLWKQQGDAEAVKMLVTNRISWEVSRILRVYRYRWTGTETFHRDGKQQLGLGDCQLRDAAGQDRHMHLVMLAYRLLMQPLRQGHAWEWRYQTLTTVGEACRAMLRETLRRTVTWAVERASEGARDVQRVVAHWNLVPAAQGAPS